MHEQQPIMKCFICSNEKEFSLRNYPQSNSNPILKFTQIAECNVCDICFAIPQYSQSQLDNYYSGCMYWTNSSKNLSNYHYYQSFERVEKTLPFLTEKRDLNILDIGAGLGMQRKVLSRTICNFNYFFIEPDDNLAASISKEKKTFRLESVDQAKVKFDFIYISHVLEHVANPVAFLQQIKSVLKKDGHIYIETPNADDQFKDDVFPHCTFFTLDTLRKTIAHSGFKAIKCNSFGSKKSILTPSIIDRIKSKIASNINFHFPRVLLNRSRYKLHHNDHEGIWIYAIIKND